MEALQRRWGDDGHSEAKKRSKVAKIRERCMNARNFENRQEQLFEFLYNIYNDLDDLTNIPYYLKYMIKYTFEFNNDILKFKELAYHREIFVNNEAIDISVFIKMMMEFSVVLGFYFMPKRPLLIICNAIKNRDFDLNLVLYILDNKIDIMTDQVFYEIIRPLVHNRPWNHYINSIKHIMTYYYPISRFFRFVETWKSKNLTIWWNRPRNHIDGKKLHNNTHKECLIMIRVIKITKFMAPISYYIRALQIFIALAKNNTRFSISQHSKICISGLILHIGKFRKYLEWIRYKDIVETALSYINCNIDHIINETLISYRPDIVRFKLKNDEHNSIRMLMMVSSNLHIMNDIRRNISSYLVLPEIR
jgi:hypothetical protein